MRNILSLLFVWWLLPQVVVAGTVDDLRRALEQSSLSQVQEKVYIHTDNSCYFVGDTLWYKAYVVRADKLTPTNLSRILYVELLSPDGLLVERQNIIVSPKGFTCGQFTLRDSLYSGYYELRAYTRWMLNFNVGSLRYSRDDARMFYNRQMAADYFRTWDGLYSRVLPVYSKPETAGDYDVRRMYQRPKRVLPQPKKDRLTVTFYPEGGHFVEGVANRVAFDATDQHGESVSVSGTVTADGQPPLSIRTEHMGRGVFTVTPTGRRLTAHFSFRGKSYDVPLPKAEPSGVALRMADGRVTLSGRGLPHDREYAVSVLCRGVLHHFAALGSDVGGDYVLPLDSLPTGVNELTVFDADGRIWASRLFFVNHHDHDAALVTSDISPRRTYQPYEPVSVTVSAQGVSGPTLLSVAVCDTGTDEPTYNDGNLMTDLLLSSDLRGFIAHPAYYFESDDATHRGHLDLLMLVQGWRRYKWEELSRLDHSLRYRPEQTLTVEGQVFRLPNVDDADADDVSSWQNGRGLMGHTLAEQADEATDAADEETSADVATPDVEYSSVDDLVSHVGNVGRLHHEVLVEAELFLGQEMVGAVQKTQGGRFVFEVPPFYGATYLNLKAYNVRDSLSKAFRSHKDTEAFNELAYPDYYVKRDMPYPVQATKYSYYQNHAPEWQVTIDEDSLSEFSMENDVHQLQDLNVKGHRRGRRATDWTKPAYVCDAYDLYNNVTDYGLSFGRYQRGLFPLQAARFLYGNMHRYNTFHVDGRLNRQVYWRNYAVQNDSRRSVQSMDNRSTEAIFNSLSLRRLQQVRFFSDYEPRNPDSVSAEERDHADATLEMVPIADHGKQLVYRDRHIFLQGFNEPAHFYQPDYSNRQPEAPTDYRRTLYWNPNALTDAEGRFTATFYNNGKETRIKMTAAGITHDGRLLHSR